MTPSPKKWWSLLKIFFSIFSKNVIFFEKKIVRWKNIENSISYEKYYIHFRRQTPLSLQKELDHQKKFFAFSHKIPLFFEKTIK